MAAKARRISQVGAEVSSVNEWVTNITSWASCDAKKNNDGPLDEAPQDEAQDGPQDEAPQDGASQGDGQKQQSEFHPVKKKPMMARRNKLNWKQQFD